MTAPTTPPPQGNTGKAAVAVGAVALAGGLPDPWLPVRWRRLAGMMRAERALFAAYSGFLSRWIGAVRQRVVHGKVVNSHAVFSLGHAFDLGVGRIVDVQMREIYEGAWHNVMLAAPVPPSRVETYLDGARNRMSGVPDQVYAQVKAEVLKANTEGWSIDELAGHVETVLSDNDVATWKNRSVVVARTEAIGAYNAGTHAGFLAYADQTGGPWEHAWLCTHDERVRPTHLAADIGTPGTGQRVPLGEPFSVGDALLDYPGALGPRATPEEVIQCRCAQLLLRPGEQQDLSNRHGKGAPA
jgi:hypothetical protein